MAFKNLLDETASIYRKGDGTTLGQGQVSSDGVETYDWMLVPNMVNIPCRIDHKLPRVEYPVEGVVKQRFAMGFFPMTFGSYIVDLQKDDQIRCSDGINYRVVAGNDKHRFAGAHHFETLLREDIEFPDVVPEIES